MPTRGIPKKPKGTPTCQLHSEGGTSFWGALGLLVLQKWCPMAVPWGASGLPRRGADSNPDSHASVSPSRTGNDQHRDGANGQEIDVLFPRAHASTNGAAKLLPLLGLTSSSCTGYDQPPQPTPRARGNVITNDTFRRAPRGDFITKSPVPTPRMGHSSSSPWQRHGTRIPKKIAPCKGTPTFQGPSKRRHHHGAPVFTHRNHPAVGF